NAQCGFQALGPNDSTNRISFGESVDEAIAIDPTTNTPYVAYRDGGNFYGASVVKYVAGQWQQVGATAFTYGVGSAEIYDQALTIDKHGIPYEACENKGYSNHCAVYQFMGGVWDTLPGQVKGFTSPCQFISITTDTNGIPYVAYENLGTTKVDVLMYNGAAWVPVGGSLGISKGQAQYVQIAFDRVHNIPYIAYEDGYKPHKDRLMVQSFTGGVWAPAADTGCATTDTVNWVSMASDKSGNIYVAYEDFSDAKNIGMLVYNGTTWSADTVQRNKYLGGPVNYTSIGVDASGNVYAAYQDLSYYGYSGLSIAEFSSGKWDFVGKSYKVSQSISAKNALYVGLAVDNTGTPIVAYEDKGVGNHAEAFMYNSVSTSWQLMATEGFSNGSGAGWNGLASYTSIATQPGTNTPYVAYRDGNNAGKSSVMSYNAGTWSIVGTPGFSGGGAKFTNMGFDAAGDPICLYTDKNTTYGITAMKYSAGAWAAIGTNSATLSTTNVYTPSMTIVKDTIYSAYQTSNYHMAVMKSSVNGTGACWVNVGPGDITLDTAAYQSIAVDSKGHIYIAFQDAPSQALGISIMEYISGTGWKWVGSRNISNGQAVYTSLKIDPTDDMPVVAFSSYGAGKEANVMKFNGTAWACVTSTGCGFSNDWTSYMSLAIDKNGVYYVAYSDWGNEVKNQGQENCTVEKYDPKVDTAWRFIPVGGACSQNGAGYESCTLDANGKLYIAYCSYGAFAKGLNCPTSIDEINGNNGVQASVYPNPSHGSFTVELQNASGKNNVAIYNVLGENIYQSKLTTDKTQINLNNQAPGIYLYRVLSENGQVVSTGKLIIQ
ncbi:MAG TPA: T9SS type A sorting domain-containing protein, partial [Bacteroidia bacterium]|nr:T9SS type A sorting domain-containing protein [Bacteroidia bacterium]